jgi:Na+-driven multidrug efflux pump
VISAAIEVIFLFSFLWRRKHIVAFGLVDIRASLVLDKIARFLKLSLPTTFNFLAWAGGLFVYHAIMGQAGVQGLAALSVMTPVESIALAMMIGTSNAAAVLVGNQLGAKNFTQVYYQAWATVILNVLIAVVVATVLLITNQLILDAFSALTNETRKLAEQFIVILAFGVVLRSVPMMAIVGVLRAGGDVKYCLYQDLFAQWVISIPLTAFAAIQLGFEPQWVYLLFLTEEIVKWGLSLSRMLSKKWMRNLIED